MRHLQGFGVGTAAVGMTISTYALARLMMNLPAGILADRHGRKLLLVWGPAITALGELTIPPSLSHFFSCPCCASCRSALQGSACQLQMNSHRLHRQTHSSLRQVQQASLGFLSSATSLLQSCPRSCSVQSLNPACVLTAPSSSRAGSVSILDTIIIMIACNCCLAGMFGCGMAGSFQQLLAWRWVTGLGSALQMSGSQLCLADISRADNRARCLGTNQACITVIVQTGTRNCDTPYVTVCTVTSYISSWHQPGMHPCLLANWYT